MGQEKGKSRWSWKLDEADLKNQIYNYDTLKITESYRGLSVLVMGCLLVISLVLSFFGIYVETSAMLYGLIIYIPILFFVYKGHRWAIVILTLLWTYEKAYQAYTIIQSDSGSVFFVVIWWLAITPIFWKALLVENARDKKLSTSPNPIVVYCYKCGAAMENYAKFCPKCGSKKL